MAFLHQNAIERVDFDPVTHSVVTDPTASDLRGGLKYCMSEKNQHPLSFHIEMRSQTPN